MQSSNADTCFASVLLVRAEGEILAASLPYGRGEPEACDLDLFCRMIEDTQNKAMLAPRIQKNSFRLSETANAATEAGNPQYQDSALNPSAHLAWRPAEARRERREGQRRGTALR